MAPNRCAALLGMLEPSAPADMPVTHNRMCTCLGKQESLVGHLFNSPAIGAFGELAELVRHRCAKPWSG